MLDQLMEIEHIIVLMLENRSFDHLLGYLSLDGQRPDVDGLKGDECNTFNGRQFRVHHLKSRIFDPDPCHGWDCVEEQLANNNGGFIQNFAKKKIQNPEAILGYYNQDDLPVYDHLARGYCICNRWFSSVPGETQPNRAFSLAGHSDGKLTNQVPLRLFQGPPVFDFLPKSVDWEFYSHDIATLRFFRGYLTEFSRIRKFRHFLQRAEQGNLPNVAWIDPNFGFPLPEAVASGENDELEAPFFMDIFHKQNDDHPPVDVGRTQELVMRIYNALRNSPQWERTLLLITYDEHGGFYDHVSPGSVKVKDDRPQFRKYGVRVPAFIISPWVRGGSTTDLVFDHTSILKTILLRFCRARDGSIPHMSLRVDSANDVSPMLSETSPRADCPLAPEIPYAIIEEEHVDRTTPPQPGELSELQQSMRALAEKAMDEGVPAHRL